MVEVEVLHNYDGQEDDELTIRVGDIISDVVKSDGGWWEGCLNGRKGVFPDNFVKERRKPEQNGSHSQKPTSNAISQISMQNKNQVSKKIDSSHSKTLVKRVSVTFPYEPQNRDELKLTVNDIIEVISEEEEGWWKGRINGKTGVFPSNFVKPLELGTEAKLGSDSKALEIKGKRLKDPSGFHEKPPILPPQPLITNKDGVQSTKPDNLEGSKAKTEEVGENKNAQANETMSQMPPAIPPKMRDNKPSERARVVFSYVAENDDELNLNEGDIVTVIQKRLEDAGWWRGMLKGKIGVFPDNFVELIPSDDKPSAKTGSDQEPTVPVSKKLERPPPPDLSKVSSVAKPTKPEEKKVKPQVPAQPPSLLSKKPVEPKPVVDSKTVTDAKPDAGLKPSKPIKDVKPDTDSKTVKELKPTLEFKSAVNLRRVALTDDHKAGEMAAKEVNGTSSLDAVSTNQKLVHLTANRARAPSRRPPTVFNVFQPSEIEMEKSNAHRRSSVDHIADVVPVPKDTSKPLTERTPENKKDFVVDNTRHDETAKSLSSPQSSISTVQQHSFVKPDLLVQLQADVSQLKQELERIKAEHNQKMQGLLHEIKEEKKAQKILLEEVEKLKKIVLNQHGKL